MELIKEGINTELIGKIKVRDFLDMMDYMIGYHQSTFLKIENWLTKSEKLFFATCIVVESKGLRYTSNKADSIFRDMFNLKRQSDISGYLGKLETKTWLKVDKKNKRINIIEPFKFNNIEEQIFKINVTIEYKNEVN